jgi:tetratricopeptide (TPR) repeat protein
MKKFLKMKMILVFLISLLSLNVMANNGNLSNKMILTSKSDDRCSKIGPDSIKTIENYSMYREFFKQKNYDEAMGYWRYIYKYAPGLRKQTFLDGASFYTMQVENATTQAEVDKYLDTLFMIYDKRLECYGEEDYILNKKALDILNYKPGQFDLAKEALEKSMKLTDKETPYYMLMPYFQVLLNLKIQDKVKPEYIFDKYQYVQSIVDYQVAQKSQYKDDYVETMAAIEEMLATIGGNIFDCSNLLPIYKQKYEENPNDLENVKMVYVKLKNCSDDPFYMELIKKINTLEPNSFMTLMLANIHLRAKEYDLAIPLMEKAIALETDNSKKAEYLYSIAEIRYSEKNFSQSREYARRASQMNPNWGKPYILIGKLYASSGSLCGPGTGYESQKVLFPALDYFYKAKNVDNSAENQKEANDLIGKYSYYLPETQELFMMGISPGSSVFIGCWIQENSTVKVK